MLNGWKRDKYNIKICDIYAITLVIIALFLRDLYRLLLTLLPFIRYYSFNYEMLLSAYKVLFALRGNKFSSLYAKRIRLLTIITND